VAEIVYGSLEEMAFRQLERKTGLLEEGKNFVHVMKASLSRQGENHDIVQVYQAGIPLDTYEYNIPGKLKGTGSIPEPERKAGEPVEPMIGRKRGFVHINGSRGICQEPLLHYSVVNVTDSSRESIHSSMRGNGYVSGTVMAMSLR
jgi:hypothetical protein